jgi:hypothetical protein
MANEKPIIDKNWDSATMTKLRFHSIIAYLSRWLHAAHPGVKLAARPARNPSADG